MSNDTVVKTHKCHGRVFLLGSVQLACDPNTCPDGCGDDGICPSDSTEEDGTDEVSSSSGTDSTEEDGTDEVSSSNGSDSTEEDGTDEVSSSSGTDSTEEDGTAEVSSSNGTNCNALKQSGNATAYIEGQCCNNCPVLQ